MKLLFKVFIFLLLVNLQDCKISSPCNALDSSCNPISSLVLES